MLKIFSDRFVLKTLRVVMGFIFFWAFLDKTFGLGFATVKAKSWLAGGSPTSGFLANATQGPFQDFFRSLSGLAWVDWMFMLGLLFVGLTLIFGKYVKWGAWAGTVMLMLMYLALLWPENNPIIDDHIVYALILIFIATKGDNI